MEPNKQKPGTDPDDPMDAELFDLAAREVNWHLSVGETDWRNAVIVQAARRVLVEGKRTTQVAEAAGISQAWLSQAIGRVREQLEVICHRENWVYKMVVLQPETMALVERLQSKTIDSLKRLQVETLAKKRAKKIKAAKSKGEAASTSLKNKSKIAKPMAKSKAKPVAKST